MSILNSNHFLHKTVNGVKQYFSPLINASTVVLKDGSRLEKDGKIYADQAVNAEMLGGKAPQYYTQPRNLLDNSDFCNPVNQRGQSSYTKGYTIDRWQVSSNLGTLELTDEGVKITRTDSQNTMKFINPIPLTEIKKDKIYTLAVCDNGSILLFSSAFPAQNDTVEVSGGDVSVEFAKAESCYVLRICIHDVNAQHVFEWAALYEGEYTAETLPPYVPKGYAVEFAECKRYFRRIELNEHGANLPLVLWGGKASINVLLDIPMRVLPSVEGWTSDRLRASDLHSTYPLTNIYVDSASTRSMITVWWTSQGSPYSTGYFLQIYLDNCSAYIDLSADL